MKNQMKVLFAALTILMVVSSCKKDAELLVKEEATAQQSARVSMLPVYEFWLDLREGGLLTTTTKTFTISPALQSGQSSLTTSYVTTPTATNRFSLYVGNPATSPNAAENVWYTVTPPNFNLQTCDEYLRVKFLAGYGTSTAPDISFDWITKKFTVNSPGSFILIEINTPCISDPGEGG